MLMRLQLGTRKIPGIRLVAIPEKNMASFAIELCPGNLSEAKVKW